MTVRRCAALRRDGTPCRVQALPTGPYCWAHAPELREKRREGRARGGQNSSKMRRLLKLSPPELQAVLSRLLTALEDVQAGRLAPRAAQAMAALARAAAAIYEQAELAARVRALEELADKNRHGRP